MVDERQHQIDFMRYYNDGKKCEPHATFWDVDVQGDTAKAKTDIKLFPRNPNSNCFDIVPLYGESFVVKTCEIISGDDDDGVYGITFERTYIIF